MYVCRVVLHEKRTSVRFVLVLYHLCVGLSLGIYFDLVFLLTQVQECQGHFAAKMLNDFSLSLLNPIVLFFYPQMRSPKSPAYDESSYWDDRFTEEKSYDWLVDFQGMKSILERYLKHDSRILILGEWAFHFP